MDFSDKIAVVTGGPSGIGKATGIAFPDYGARVAVLHVNEKPDSSLAGDRRDIDVFRADVSNSGEMQAIANGLRTRYGRPRRYSREQRRQRGRSSDEGLDDFVGTRHRVGAADPRK